MHPNPKALPTNQGIPTNQGTHYACNPIHAKACWYQFHIEELHLCKLPEDHSTTKTPRFLDIDTTGKRQPSHSGSQSVLTFHMYVSTFVEFIFKSQQTDCQVNNAMMRLNMDQRPVTAPQNSKMVQNTVYQQPYTNNFPATCWVVG
jgi:hypothetical protein